MKFYRCEHCGNLFLTLNDGLAVPKCCEQDMVELRANTTDGVAEKHVPVINQDGNEVVAKVGEIEHPMLPEHHIEWVAIETDDQVLIQYLKPGDKPLAEFSVPGNIKKLAAYEYCNLHGLWKIEK